MIDIQHPYSECLLVIFFIVLVLYYIIAKPLLLFQFKTIKLAQLLAFIQ